MTLGEQNAETFTYYYILSAQILTKRLENLLYDIHSLQFERMERAKGEA